MLLKNSIPYISTLNHYKRYSVNRVNTALSLLNLIANLDNTQFCDSATVSKYCINCNAETFAIYISAAAQSFSCVYNYTQTLMAYKS